MKVIFLDVDGVLNSWNSIARCCGFIGIDGPKVALLKQIVDATDAKIVLTSTWKLDYDKYLIDGYQNKIGKYLREKLREKSLEVFDTTTKYETNLAHRGEGIANWAAEHNISAKDFIVLDDEVFDDYEEYNILPRLIKSKWYDKDANNGGLNEDLVKEAIKLLNN